MTTFMKYASLAVLLAAVGAAGWVLRSGDTAPQVGGDAAPGDPIVEITLPTSFSETARLGQRVFEARCASCHGPHAVGQKGVAPPLIHKIYEPSHHGDAAFQLAVTNGVRAHHWPFGNMPAIEGLSPAQVTYVTRYVREIQRANGIF